jgi:hypothetical protein
MKWEQYATHMAEVKKCIQNLSENLKGRDSLKDLGIDESLT